MSYSLMMEGRSVEDLHDYINNYQKYWPDAIEAAVAELKNRGEVFTLEEQAEIEKRIEIRRQAVKDFEMQQPAQPKYEEPLEVTTPQLYSQVAVIGFTLIFSVIAGGILMNANLKQLGNEVGRKTIILFTFAFVALEIFVMFLVSPALNLVFNIVASAILGLVFWAKYIGNINYQSKSIVKPLLIWLCVIAVMWLITMQAMQASGLTPEQLVPKP